MKTESAYFTAQIYKNKELIESENKKRVADLRLSYGMTIVRSPFTGHLFNPIIQILTIAQSVRLVQYLRQHLAKQNNKTKEQLQATHRFLLILALVLR